LIPVDAAKRAFALLRQEGFRVYAASMRGTSIYEERLARRSIFLFGAEGVGLDNRLLAAADEVLMIPGTGEVESLNVSCASAVVLAEYWRTHAMRPKRARRASR